MRDDGLVEALHTWARQAPSRPAGVVGEFIGSWNIGWSGLDAAGADAHRSRRAVLRLGARWPRRAGRLDRPGSRRAWCRACRRSPSTARRSASTTQRSEPGARPGWIRSTAACAASSGAPPVGRSCSSATRTTRSCAGASPTSGPTRSPGAGEVSRDGGATWAQDEEMRITRRAATGDPLVGPARTWPGRPVCRGAPALRPVRRILGHRVVGPGCGRPRAQRSRRGAFRLGARRPGRAGLWILPRRGERGEAGAPAFHGTWIRFFDPSIGAWRGTWMDPVNGDVLRFVVRPAGDEILMLADSGGAAVALALQRDRGGLGSASARVLSRWRRYLGPRREDASHTRLGLYRISGTNLYALAVQCVQWRSTRSSGIGRWTTRPRSSAWRRSPTRSR